MRIRSDNGNQLELRITGYQFPDAEDPRKRFSWHTVEGSIACEKGSWTFHWAALSCDESSMVSSWLRTVASAPVGSKVKQLTFTEPNLTFDASVDDQGATVVVGFDLEFRPPWDTRPGAGDPYLVDFVGVSDQLDRAANEWEADIVGFPDGLAS